MMKEVKKEIFCFVSSFTLVKYLKIVPQHNLPQHVWYFHAKGLAWAFGRKELLVHWRFYNAKPLQGPRLVDHQWKRRIHPNPTHAKKRRIESWQSSGWTPHNGWRWYGWPRLWRSEGFLFSKTRFTVFILFHNEMLVGQTWLFHRAVSGEIWIVPWCHHDQQCKLVVEIKMGKEF